jgi:hypothetical protein
LKNFIKLNNQQKGEKKTKKEEPSPSQKKKPPKWVTKGQRNKICYKAPLVARSISKIKKDEKPKRIINPKKPSPIMKMHLQI